jgi:hypothetical protein
VTTLFCEKKRENREIQRKREKSKGKRHENRPFSKDRPSHKRPERKGSVVLDRGEDIDYNGKNRNFCIRAPMKKKQNDGWVPRGLAHFSQFVH